MFRFEMCNDCVGRDAPTRSAPAPVSYSSLLQAEKSARKNNPAAATAAAASTSPTNTEKLDTLSRDLKGLNDSEYLNSSLFLPNRAMTELNTQ